MIAAVAAPLYGTIAGLHSARWLPLGRAVVVAAGALFWLFALS